MSTNCIYACTLRTGNVSYIITVLGARQWLAVRGAAQPLSHVCTSQSSLVVAACSLQFSCSSEINELIQTNAKETNDIAKTVSTQAGSSTCQWLTILLLK